MAYQTNLTTPYNINYNSGATLGITFDNVNNITPQWDYTHVLIFGLQHDSSYRTVLYRDITRGTYVSLQDIRNAIIGNFTHIDDVTGNNYENTYITCDGENDSMSGTVYYNDDHYLNIYGTFHNNNSLPNDITYDIFVIAAENIEYYNIQNWYIYNDATGEYQQFVYKADNTDDHINFTSPSYLNYDSNLSFSNLSVSGHGAGGRIITQIEIRCNKSSYLNVLNGLSYNTKYSVNNIINNFICNNNYQGSSSTTASITIIGYDANNNTIQSKKYDIILNGTEREYLVLNSIYWNNAFQDNVKDLKIKKNGSLQSVKSVFTVDGEGNKYQVYPPIHLFTFGGLSCSSTNSYYDKVSVEVNFYSSETVYLTFSSNINLSNFSGQYWICIDSVNCSYHDNSNATQYDDFRVYIDFSHVTPSSFTANTPTAITNATSCMYVWNSSNGLRPYNTSPNYFKYATAASGSRTDGFASAGGASGISSYYVINEDTQTILYFSGHTIPDRLKSQTNNYIINITEIDGNEFLTSDHNYSFTAYCHPNAFSLTYTYAIYDGVAATKTITFPAESNGTTSFGYFRYTNAPTPQRYRLILGDPKLPRIAPNGYSFTINNINYLQYQPLRYDTNPNYSAYVLEATFDNNVSCGFTNIPYNDGLNHTYNIFDYDMNIDYGASYQYTFFSSDNAGQQNIIPHSTCINNSSPSGFKWIYSSFSRTGNYTFPDIAGVSASNSNGMYICSVFVTAPNIGVYTHIKNRGAFNTYTEQEYGLCSPSNPLIYWEHNTWFNAYPDDNVQATFSEGNILSNGLYRTKYSNLSIDLMSSWISSHIENIRVYTNTPQINLLLDGDLGSGQLTSTVQSYGNSGYINSTSFEFPEADNTSKTLNVYVSGFVYRNKNNYASHRLFTAYVGTITIRSISTSTTLTFNSNS